VRKAKGMPPVKKINIKNNFGEISAKNKNIRTRKKPKENIGLIEEREAIRIETNVTKITIIFLSSQILRTSIFFCMEMTLFKNSPGYMSL
jgi:hypothetical protein